MLAGRRILLCVSGGVAAYKAAYLARRLVEGGAQVKAVMTRSAVRFLGPQTLAAIAGEHPHLDFFEAQSVTPHTELGRWAEVICVAPATAATLARIANGTSDDLLSATVLASRAPVVVAPAMHTEMWEHPATRRNLLRLVADGVVVVGPAEGALAGGDVGAGRMAEPEAIVEALQRVLGAGPMSGWRVLVTAGGTREPIDSVRYLGNRSSGKMGNAIAIEAARRGALVTLVTTVPGPVEAAVDIIAVETAEEMAEAIWGRAPDADVVVLAAAVADFRPAEPAPGKLRRAAGPPDLTLTETPDILAGVAALDPRPFLVGFAAEAGPPEGALSKARRVDLLVANDVTAPGSGFGTDTNRVTLIHPDGSLEAWELLPKREVAGRLWERIVALRASEAS